MRFSEVYVDVVRKKAAPIRLEYGIDNEETPAINDPNEELFNVESIDALIYGIQKSFRFYFQEDDEDFDLNDLCEYDEGIYDKFRRQLKRCKLEDITDVVVFAKSMFDDSIDYAWTRYDFATHTITEGKKSTWGFKGDKFPTPREVIDSIL